MNEVYPLIYLFFIIDNSEYYIIRGLEGFRDVYEAAIFRYISITSASETFRFALALSVDFDVACILDC